MSPEQAIQTAWVNRAREEIEDRKAQGLAARELHLPPWLPEVAVQALRDAGWTGPPSCGCGPVAADPKEVAMRDMAAMSQEEMDAAIARDLRALLDGGGTA